MEDSNQPAGQERPNTWVWGFLAVAWVCILLMGYQLGLHERFLSMENQLKDDQRMQEQPAPRQAPVVVSAPVSANPEVSGEPAPVQQSPCDAMPPTGGKLLVYTTHSNTGPVQRAPMDIDNQHYFPVLLRFTSISAGGAGKVVYIDRQIRDRLDIPAGNYRLVVEVGDEWCSITKGFNHGHKLQYHESVTVGEGSASVLRFVPMGVEPQDLLVSFTSGGLDTQAGAGKTMELSRQMDGHFHVRAQVNNYPVTFMVDTGATTTTIPWQVAKELGLDRKCKSAKFSTAAGSVNGCIAVADELRFGDFTLRQIQVAFNQANNMPLLGMNVLSQFRIQQLGSTLLISN